MKKLIPPFLKSLDKHLLLNYPVLWVSRIHYVLFIGIIMSAFFALVGLAIPLNTNHTQDLGLWYFLFTLLAIVAFCFWIYRNVTFNIEKKFGKRKWIDEYKLFFLNFTCILIFFSFPFLFTGIYNYRVANIYSNEEFIDDINHMNIAEMFVMNNLNDYQEYYDSVKQTYSYDLRNRISFETHTPWELKDDTTQHPNLLTESGLKKIYKQRHTEQEIKFYIQHYMELFKKYDVFPNVPNTVNEQYARYLDLLKNSPINSGLFSYNNYNDYELHDTLNNIARAKYRQLFIWDKDFLNVIFYTCFYLSLLIMLFKIVYWKQFLITLLSLIIIPIILFIISQLMPYSEYSDRGDTYIILLLLTLGVAIAFTLTGIAKSKRFNAFKNICAQIVYLAMPVLPLTIILLCRPLFYDYTDNYDYAVETAPTATEMAIAVDSVRPAANVIKDTVRVDTTLSNLVTVNAEPVPSMELATQNSYYNSPEYIARKLEQEYWDQMYETCLFVATYGGLLLFMIVIMPLMKQLFVKQLALPRKS